MGKTATSRFAAGVASASAGAALWGFTGTCSQFLLTNYEISALFITTTRLLFAGLILVAVAAVREREALVRLLHDRCDLARVALFGLVGLFMCQLTYLIAIGYTNAGTTTVIQTMNVVYVLIVVCVLARRLPRPMEALGVALALVATVLICTKGDFGSMKLPVPGLVWGLIEAGTVAFYVMYPTRLIEKWGTFAVTGVAMLAGFVVSIVALFGAGVTYTASDGPLGWELMLPNFDFVGILVLAAVVILGTVMSFTLYLFGVSVVGSVNGALLGTIEPVAAAVLAVVWMQTPFTWADWLGMVLMIAMVFLVSTQRRRQP